MAVVGLFAGIGGFELAFSRAGFETNLLVEIDPAARAVLKEHFPAAAVRSDVLETRTLPAGTTVVTAGFPCQNLSMAGDKAGIDGTKSAVVKRLFELVGASDTPVIVVENVYFMLQLDAGRAMAWLVEQFEEHGYKWAYRTLNTMGFGLPQRRRRVYLVACRDLDPRDILFADECPVPASPKPRVSEPLGFYWTEGRSGIGMTVDGIPPLKVGSTVGIPSPPAVLFPDGEVLIPSLRSCEELQGFPAGWTEAAGQCGGRNPEWRLIGNAVSVPVAEWIARRIKAPGVAGEFETTRLENGGRWPPAGWNVGAGRMGVAAGDRPVAMEQPSIALFRKSDWSRLSERALSGFVRRVMEGGLHMPDEFLDRVRRARRKSHVSKGDHSPLMAGKEAVNPARSALMARIGSRDTTAGDDRPPSSVFERIPLPIACPRTAWPARHRFPKTQEGNIRPWVFLASSRRVPKSHHPQDPSIVLVGQVRQQPDPRRAERSCSVSHGWRILIVWECETKDTEALSARLMAFMEAQYDQDAAEARPAESLQLVPVGLGPIRGRLE